MPVTELAALPFRTMRDVRTVQAALVNVLRDYSRGAGDGTTLLRRAAEMQVELRQYFARPDGETDWLGKSYGYRQLMTETYGLAGILPSERKKLGDAVRYHVINVLRERLSPEEIAALDLREQDGPTRAKETRERTRAIVDAATAEGRIAGVHGGPVKLVTYSLAVVSTIKADAIRELSEAERQELMKDASALRREVDRILRLADGRRVTGPRKKK